MAKAHPGHCKIVQYIQPGKQAPGLERARMTPAANVIGRFGVDVLPIQHDRA